jgi:dTMP kinase
MAVSFVKNRNLLNDLPNAVRVFFGSLSGILFDATNFLYISAALFLLLAGILLNDEYQRRAFDSLLRKRRGGTIVLLGIDGSGKTTHSHFIESWLSQRGYLTSVIPFHKYLFVERLSRKSRVTRDKKKKKGNPLRPLASLIDNFLFLIATSFGSSLEGKVVIYDRFIWSTYIKYEALGYPAKPLRMLYMLFRPTVAIMLDIPISRSIEVIKTRPEHISYTESILSKERKMYLEIASKHSYPIIDATRDFSSVQGEIELFLSRIFPKVA